MIFRNLNFKFEERGFKDTLVLIPGWATDYRIFSPLNLNYNYLFPTDNYFLDLGERLLGVLNKRSIDKVSIFGWSLGGFLGADFAFKNPGRINELILLGIRKKFDSAALEGIKTQLIENKKACLYKIYLGCFSDTEKENLLWFKEKLLKDYISSLKLEDLIEGLDYLSKTEINLKPLAKIKKIMIFHGLKDKIAPVEEAREMQQELPDADFLFMPEAGHLPFMQKDFAQVFYGSRTF